MPGPESCDFPLRIEQAHEEPLVPVPLSRGDGVRGSSDDRSARVIARRAAGRERHHPVSAFARSPGGVERSLGPSPLFEAVRGGAVDRVVPRHPATTIVRLAITVQVQQRRLRNIVPVVICCMHYSACFGCCDLITDRVWSRSCSRRIRRAIVTGSWSCRRMAAAWRRSPWRVDEHAPLRPGYELKLNSYDLGVDIELADAIQRLRFEHPEVRAVVITLGQRSHLLRGRQHPHARVVDAPVQGQLLQVHQRDAAVARGRVGQLGAALARGVQRADRRRRLRARARLRRDRARSTTARRRCRCPRCRCSACCRARAG